MQLIIGSDTLAKINLPSGVGMHHVYVYLNLRRDAAVNGYRHQVDVLYHDLTLHVCAVAEDPERAMELALRGWQPSGNPHIDPWRAPRVGDVMEIEEDRFYAITPSGLHPIDPPRWYEAAPEDYHECSGLFYEPEPDAPAAYPLRRPSGCAAIGYLPAAARQMLTERGAPSPALDH